MKTAKDFAHLKINGYKNKKEIKYLHDESIAPTLPCCVSQHDKYGDVKNHNHK